MGLYDNIDVDFAARTVKIIQQYDQCTRPGPENFEVTLLVNCLVGLLILPQQRRYDSIPDTPIEDLAQWSIEPAFIQNWGSPRNGQNPPKTLKELVRRLRNAVAHFHIEAEGTEADIERLKFFDDNQFSATIPVRNLRLFVERFADSMSTFGAGA